MKRENYLLIICFFVHITIVFIACKKDTDNNNEPPPDEPYPTMNQNPVFDLQGFNMCAWGKDWWSNDALVDEAIKFALTMGANTLALDWAVNFYDDGNIIPIDDANSLHPYWTDISKLIAKAKSKGFYIILKPHTTLSNSAFNRNIWNTDINTFLPSNFFPAYKSYLLQLAEFAKNNNVDAICFGTEMNHLDWQFRDEWVALIDTLRSSFSGMITYDALFNRFYYNVKDIEEVVFWDKVDYIGVSLYVPFTTDDNAVVDTLRKAWFYDLAYWFEIDNAMDYIINISNQYGKKILALEGGYPSMTGGLFLLNCEPSELKYEHYTLQSNGLDAYLGILDEYKQNWFKGITLWEITPYMIRPEALNSVHYKQGFTVYKKPAEEIVKKHFFKTR